MAAEESSQPGCSLSSMEEARHSRSTSASWWEVLSYCNSLGTESAPGSISMEAPASACCRLLIFCPDGPCVCSGLGKSSAESALVLDVCTAFSPAHVCQIVKAQYINPSATLDIACQPWCISATGTITVVTTAGSASINFASPAYFTSHVHRSLQTEMTTNGRLSEA